MFDSLFIKQIIVFMSKIVHKTDTHLLNADGIIALIRFFSDFFIDYK